MTLNAWQPSKITNNRIKNKKLEKYHPIYIDYVWQIVQLYTLEWFSSIKVTHRDLGMGATKKWWKMRKVIKSLMTTNVKWIFSYFTKVGKDKWIKKLVNNFLGSSCCCTSYILSIIFFIAKTKKLKSQITQYSGSHSGVSIFFFPIIQRTYKFILMTTLNIALKAFNTTRQHFFLMLRS